MSAALDASVDLALDLGEPVVVPALGLVVVPDVMMIEGTANGMTSPPTWTVHRPDGRCAHLYRWPAAEDCPPKARTR